MSGILKGRLKLEGAKTVAGWIAPSVNYIEAPTE